MQVFKRILFLLSFLFVYVIVRELLSLYILTASIHPALGYAVLLLIGSFIIYFIGVPLYRILTMPVNLAPSRNLSETEALARARIRSFKKNPFLLRQNFDFSTIEENAAGYHKIVDFLEPESRKIRKRYVLELFYGSSVSQNGFLDAILILSSSINLVKEIFILYHGRVHNKDLLRIARRIYLNMAIGGTEGVEFASQQLFSKFATDSMKSIPFADRVFGSLVDGFVNAALLTRISLITENYCKLLTIQSEKDLYPSSEFIMQTTQLITSNIFEKITREIIRVSREKTVDYVMFAVNPVAHLLRQTATAVAEGTSKVTSYPKEMIKDVAQIVHKPFIFGIERVWSIFKKD